MTQTPFATAPTWRLIGLWMAAGIALLQGFYALWAFVDPQAVALYRGGAVEGHGVTLWVYAYGSRTLFVAMVVAFLLRRRDLEALKWAALLGPVMPFSDAWSALRLNAPQTDIVRHVLTAIYLLLTFAILTRATRRGESIVNAAAPD